MEKPQTRVKAGVLVGLVIVQVAATWLLVVPGHLLADESIYHWMTRAFYDTGGFALWNGFEEFPSRELTHSYFFVTNGKLYPQYPYLFPVLAAPLFGVFGYFGLFVLNSMAFIGVVGLTFLIAQKLFQDVESALNSCLIMIFATFLWPYSQEAWPHCTVLFFELSAFILCLYAFFDGTGQKSRMLCLACGLVIGFSPGIRLDGILMLPAVMLLFVFARPWRPWEAGMAAFGAIPGTVVMALVNHTKFGIMNPFMYSQIGQPHTRASPGLLVCAAAVPIAAAWALTRSFTMLLPGSHAWKARTGVSVALMTLALLVPGVVDLLRELAVGAFTLLVDLRVADLSLPFGPRSAGGAVTHLGGYKKTLLQSLPYLPILIIPFMRAIRQDKDYPAILTLIAVPAVYVLYYSHSFLGLDAGGLCLNARFLIPCLPFLSILTAYSMKELGNTWTPRPPAILSGIILAVAAAGFAVFWGVYGSRTDQMEFPVLTFPLVLATLLLLCCAAGEIPAWPWRTAARKTAWMIFLVGMAWAGAMTFFYDYPLHRLGRDVHNYYTRELLDIVPRNSIVFADHRSYAPAIGLVDKPGIRIASPGIDDFKDFPALLRFQLGAGRRAFGLLTNRNWAELKTGPLAGYRLIPWLVTPVYSIREIALPYKVRTGGHN